MPEGGELSVETRKIYDGVNGESLEIEVSDTGYGIDEKYLNRIFEPFFTTRRDTGGTGLGLSITRMIVEKHGGNLSVKSEPGKGTEFAIELQVCKDGVPEAYHQAVAQLQTAAPPPVEPKH